MVYDPPRRECVLFGGYGFGSIGFVATTHRYRAVSPATVLGYGQGCGGTVATPGFALQLHHAPYLGLPFSVQIDVAPANQPSFVAAGMSRTDWLGVPLPLPLAFLGMNGCQLLVSGDVLLPTAVAGTTATTTLQLPVTPGLVGVRFFLQGFVFAPGANPAGLVNTAALECMLGAP